MIDMDLTHIETNLKTTRNNYGLLLTSSSSVLVIAESFKKGNNYSPYYLKQLRPQKQYLTGLFKDKTKNSTEGVYRGKIGIYNIVIKVNESEQTALITYYKS